MEEGKCEEKEGIEIRNVESESNKAVYTHRCTGRDVRDVS